VALQHELRIAALRALGIERLVLAIHDVSFPSRSGEDVGRGSPYSSGGQDFLAFVRELGFDGVQLGPQGQTSPGNSSPYDGSVFSKNVLSIALPELATERFASALDAATVAAAAASTPAGDSRAHYSHAYTVQTRALAVAAANLAARDDSAARAQQAQLQAFAGRAPWLAHDARFEAFAALHGTDDWRTWPDGDRAPSRARVAEVERAQASVIATYGLGQYVLDVQHQALRTRAQTLGLRLYGDLQVGLSLRDRWTRDHLFLARYRMGAPPSRTNPEGQAWGYPVLDPRQYLRRFVADDQPSAPLAFARARITKLFSELDGVRIDHPHGLVCPWVYDGEAPDPSAAVVQGARLFETPSSAAHPSLGALALARPDQIDDRMPPYDDDHVSGLTSQQVAEYARMFDVVMEAAHAAGRGANDILCEVLSTCPEPLARVMDRHGFGRFRVTQKASLVDLHDGYRGENAEARDWTMIGNHDTEPLLAVVERWRKDGTLSARADYLAQRLEAEPARRAALAAGLLAQPGALAQAMFAELFVGPAANVLVFFADLYGERETYNTPGLVSERNWSLRVPQAFREVYEARRARGEALDVPRALALAMRARGAAFVEAHAGLLAALEATTASGGGPPRGAPPARSATG